MDREIRISVFNYADHQQRFTMMGYLYPMAREAFDRNNFEKEIKRLIDAQGLTQKQTVAFAWRCGVRALPLLGAKGDFDFWPAADRAQHLYRLLWALDQSAASTFTRTALADLASAVHGTDSAAKAANRDAAARVSYATTYTTFSARSRTDDEARDVAARAASYAASAANWIGMDMSAHILADVKQPWSREGGARVLGPYGDGWPKFLQALENIGCSYWGKVIEGWFESGFQIDEAAFKRRLSVPLEIREQGAAVVGQYLENLERGARRMNEARIIILGDKGAGKTSIARKLVDPNAELPASSESTRGVDTTHWEMAEEDFNVRIWDFAGHTVTHAVHQFFLSERSLYILVCNGRTEEYNRLEYWLSQMQNYGGDSEVIILVNEKDAHQHSIPINTLRETYPITDLFSFSIKDDAVALVQFRERVQNYVLHHPSWEKQEIPETYYQVKEKLESLFVLDDPEQGEERITKARFDEIAEGFEVEDQDVLLRNLHHLGVSLWYEGMADVNTLVLNPEWISHGIYTLINWTHGKGKYGLTLNQFQVVFQGKDSRYPVSEHAFLFELMKHYQLAFEKKRGAARFLVIPHLLPEDRPDKELVPAFPVGDSLMLRYKSEIDLPKHLISRFIVAHHEEIRKAGKDPLVWREGVILQHKTRTIAMVVSRDRSLEVTVKGDDKTAYLDQLRTTINWLFKDFKKQKPDLEYRVEAFGKLDGHRSSEALQPTWATDLDILQHHKRDIPLFDTRNDQMIPAQAVMQQYDLRGSTFIAGQGHHIELDQSTKTFNFKDCNFDLQGNLNDLSQLLTEEGKSGEAKELANVAKALEAAEACQTPEEVKKKGIGKRLERFTHELADEKSKLHQVVKGVKNGVSIAQDIAKSYNDIAQWCGLPQVPKPFLKQEK